VVREALNLVRATLPASIRVETHLAGELPPVEVADNQIYQVVVNLATNASHAIGTRPGLIEVRLEACEVKDDLAAATPGLKAGRYVVLSVRDDGCGMDAATLSCIFDPFFTTKPQGQGTGLGLSLVHGILKSHGGAISVQSRPGEGAEFRLWFPARSTSVSESMASEKQPDSRPLPLRVMYVDDETALVSLLSRVLNRMGHRVTAFTDPREALRAFTENPRDFDVVVTDLAMPHVSGLDLARQLRAVRGDLPMVLTSGCVRPGDQKLAAEYGISEIILKPDTIEDLGHALDRIFREAEADGVGGKSAPSRASE
jgi:CheY-like chemotaxis protein/anti-sigma regulatory factor (Ser/Thr protein kinase)